MLLEELVSIGFEREEAQKLAESSDFHHRKKSRQELTDLFNKISGVYNCTFGKVKKAILSFPPFAGLDHERVVKQGIEVYGADNKEKVKKAILTHPQFAGLDHERVVREAVEVYGNKKGVKRAILSFPQFAGYDHERVVKQKRRLGRMAGLSDEETINYLLDIPTLAGYSAKRYLAAFDIGRQLESEGFQQDERMLNAFFSYYQRSPYVPDFKRKRISHVMRKGITDYKEPPLLKAMRKRLIKTEKSR